MLIDAGPLVALLDKSDPNHALCRTAFEALPAAPLITTWPCFTEAMYLLGRNGGGAYQRHLWRLYSSGRIVLWNAEAPDVARMEALMNKYHDTPMDLADSSLLAAAEKLDLRKVFTLDGDFLVYRLFDNSPLQISPQRSELSRG